VVLERYRHSIFSVVSPMSLDISPRPGTHLALADRIKRRAPYVGEVQVADAPGRFEPGTGEINYPRITQALRDIGYRGTFGLRPVTRTRAGAIPRRLHADAFAISGWITSVIGRQPCLAGRPEMETRHVGEVASLEMENAACRRGSQPPTRFPPLVGLACHTTCRPATTGTQLNPQGKGTWETRR
jgi:hypothetical protein